MSSPVPATSPAARTLSTHARTHIKDAHSAMPPPPHTRRGLVKHQQRHLQHPRARNCARTRSHGTIHQRNTEPHSAKHTLPCHTRQQRQRLGRARPVLLRASYPAEVGGGPLEQVDEPACRARSASAPAVCRLHGRPCISTPRRAHITSSKQVHGPACCRHQPRHLSHAH